jgi:hypothetical protein
MSNTVIKLKYAVSTRTPADNALAVGEAAYSQTSKTLFLGVTGGGAPINIGGLHYTETMDAATAAATASTLMKRDSSNQVAATTFTGALVGNASTATTAAAWATGRTISLTGDVTYTSAALNGSGDVTGAATLSASGSAGTYTKITVDSKGRATGGATARIDELAAPTSAVAFGSQRITALATPTATTDAANKAYVDSVVQGLDPKASAQAATTASITLSGTQTIDGIALSAGARVLVKNQSTASQNGIYIVAAGAWARSTDADTFAKLVSAYLFIEQGTTQADTSFTCTVDTGGSLGSTAITFVQFSGAGTNTAGTGLTLSGNAFSITNTGVGAGNKGSATAVPVITVNAQGQITGSTDTNIAIAASQVASGTVAIARGGTNAASFTSGQTVGFDGTRLVSLPVASFNLTGSLGATKTITSLTVDSYGRTTAATAADIAIAASQVTSGSFAVGTGGTGRTTLAANGVLVGAGTSAVTSLNSSTEGHLLQVNSSGVPVFDMLQGGTF